MSFDYADVARDALDIITEFGTDVTITKIESGTYDTKTGENAVFADGSKAKGIVFDFGTGISTISGNLIQSEDKRLLLEAAAKPEFNDVFTANGKTYSPVSIGEINPAGITVLFDIHVRAH